MLKNLKLLAFSVYLPTVLLSFSKGLLLPILPVFVTSFELSYAMVGLILAMDAIGTLAGDIPAGSLLRYWDKKWVMVLGLIIMGLSVLGLSWASSVWQLLIYRFCSGLGNALTLISLTAYLTELSRQQQRGRIIALFGGITRIGQFVGPALGGLMAVKLGIRSPFSLFALLCLLAVTSTVIFVKRSDLKPSIKRGHSQLFGVLQNHYGIFLSAGAGMIFAQMIRAGRQVIIPLYGSDILGLNVAAIGLIMSISSAIDMSLFIPAGFIMDKWGRKYAIVPSFLLQALGMAVLPLATGFGSLLLFASITGFGNGLSSGSMMTLGADLAPKDALGEFLGVWHFIGDLGDTSGPLAVGTVAGLFSLSISALVLAVIGALSASIFAFLVPETLKRP